MGPYIEPEPKHWDEYWENEGKGKEEIEKLETDFNIIWDRKWIPNQKDDKNRFYKRNYHEIKNSEKSYDTEDFIKFDLKKYMSYEELLELEAEARKDANEKICDFFNEDKNKNDPEWDKKIKEFYKRFKYTDKDYENWEKNIKKKAVQNI